MIKWLWGKFWGKSREEKQVVVLGCIHTCPKSTKCPLWLILENTIVFDDGRPEEKKSEGRCSIAWIPTLMIEIKKTIGSK